MTGFMGGCSGISGLGHRARGIEYGTYGLRAYKMQGRVGPLAHMHVCVCGGILKARCALCNGPNLHAGTPQTPISAVLCHETDGTCK